MSGVRRVVVPRSLALPIFALALPCSFRAPASADCEEPRPELAWSYPSDGAAAIPTNAAFFFLSTVNVEAVELDGRRLEARELPGTSPARSFDPGQLAPNRAYTLTVTLRDGGLPIELSFETGAGARAQLAPAIELLAISSTGNFSAACRKVVAAQDCYDEGQDTHVLLESRGEALAYLVTWGRDPGAGSSFRSVFWPASCGAPSVYFFSDQEACYTVHALDETGQVSSSRELCGAARNSEAEADAGGTNGCSTGAGASGMAGGLLLFVFAARWRRAPRAAARAT